MPKLLPRNKNNIHQYLFGGLISDASIGLNVAAQYLRSLYNKLFNDLDKVDKDIVTSNTSNDPRYDPKLATIQQLLYNVGAFGNIPESKAVDGIPGKLTTNAIEVALSKGYTIKDDKLVRYETDDSFLGKLQTAWSKLIGTYKPTLEEFKEQKRLEIRNEAALVNELTVTPSFTEMVGTPSMKDHDLDLRGKKYGWTDAQIKSEFTKYAQLTREYLRTHPNIEPLAKQRIEETLRYYDKVAANPKYHDKNGAGFGCIYTASGAYGDLFRYQNNKDLTNRILKGEDTGFEVYIYNPDTDLGKLKRGDILQIGSFNKKYAHHAEMVTDTSSSKGVKLAQTKASGFGLDDKENNWENYGRMVWHGRQEGMLLLRFVGTKEQNRLWEEEYYKLYG